MDYFFNLALRYQCNDLTCSDRIPNSQNNSCNLKNDGCSYYVEWDNAWVGCVIECPSKLFINEGV
jgi:hypothetical protein